MQAVYRVLAKQIWQIITQGVSSWRQKMYMYLGIQVAKAAKVAVDLAYDFTQKIILDEMQELSILSKETAKIANRPLFALETTTKENDILIEMINDVIKINKDNINSVREGEKIVKENEAKRNQAISNFVQEMTKLSVEHALSSNTPSKDQSTIDKPNDNPYSLHI